MPGSAVRRHDKASNDRLSLDQPSCLSTARCFHHSSYSAGRIAAERAEHDLTVSVCLPARDCAQTVGQIVAILGELRVAGAIDEIVVVDAASEDGTATVAERAGAVVYQEAELMPSYGPVLGKGDAMWRALSVLEGELVCFLDADTEGFSGHFLTGLLGPLVCERGVSFVKAFYRRPFAAHGPSGEQDRATHGEGGGRVNHLLARPALELFYPQLAQVLQPLAGEVAARRELLGAAALRHRLRSGDSDVDRRMAPDRHGGDRSGGPRGAPQSPPAAVGTHADGVDGAGHDRRQARTRRSSDRVPSAGAARERRCFRACPRGTPTVCERESGMSARCVYIDLDGTLLGRGASLLHDGEGAVSIAGVRAVQSCLRAEVEVVLMSGRRRAQVFEDARLLGQSSFIYEAGRALCSTARSTG